MAGVLDTVNKRTQLVGQNRLELLLFRLQGNQIYGINVFKVKEVLQCPNLTSMPKSDPVVRGVAHIRGGTIPIMDLSLATGNAPLTDLKNKFVIITEYNMKTQGFLVSSVERIINMNWSEIHPPPKGTGNAHYLTAVTKLNDRMVEIIDVEKILSEVAPMTVEVSDNIVSEAMAAEAPSFHVLVVDDSKIALKQTTRCIEQVGVTTTKLMDGKAAWEHLLEMLDEGKDPMKEYLMIISDIEMPEMDGYTLTAEIRAHPQLKGMYIMLHTSLSGVFNEAMVKKVGADNFLPKFKPDELAEIVVHQIEKRGGVVPALDGE
ncbi:chemotaxis protein CheV [Gynuella sp.]|uniref:chemotaxis protein CheV n=1 Tax=Gynuella sp. TaxID=2969146 RepID=UPI003D0F6526